MYFFCRLSRSAYCLCRLCRSVYCLCRLCRSVYYLCRLSRSAYCLCRLFRSVYYLCRLSRSAYCLCRLCCSAYCFCVNVYCTTANKGQPNSSEQIYHKIYNNIFTCILRKTSISTLKSITKNYCVLHIQSNTTIFHLTVQYVYNYMFRPYIWAIFRL